MASSSEALELQRDSTPLIPTKEMYSIDWAAEWERNDWRRTVLEGRKSGLRGWLEWSWNGVQGWIAVVIIGVTTGLVVSCIDMTGHWVEDVKNGLCVTTPWLSRTVCCRHATSECDEFQDWWKIMFGISNRLGSVFNFFIYVFFSAGMAALSAWLVHTFAKSAAGSGIPEVKTILAGTHMKNVLGIWTLLIKSIGVILSVGSGLTLGKEGPYIHVSTCIGNIVSRVFSKYRHMESKKRELLSASCAAGVSVAFGAPIGGVLFSLEEASYFFPHKVMWRAMTCAIVAALVLKKMDPAGTGKLVLFQVNYQHDWHWFEIIPYSICGIFGGVIGGSFIKFNLKWTKEVRRKYWKDNPIKEVTVVAVVTAVLCYWNPYTRGSLTEMLFELFNDCSAKPPSHLCTSGSNAYWQLTLAWVLKFLLAIVTFGCRVPAGMFIPPLYIGACFGRVMGMIVHDIHQNNKTWSVFAECRESQDNCIIPGVYAIVCAAACLCGITRITVSLIVIIFELTGGLTYLVPVMVSVMVAKWTAEWVNGHDSIYEALIDLNEYPFLDPKLEVNSRARAISIASTNLSVLQEEGNTLQEIDELLARNNYEGFPVVKDDLIIGYISRPCLVGGIKRAAERDPQVKLKANIVFNHASLFDAGTFSARGARRVPYDEARRKPVQSPRLVTDTNAATSSSSASPEDWESVPNVDLSQYLDSTPLQIDANSTIHRVVHIFKSLGCRYCLVARHGRLEGMITRKDLLKFIRTRVAHGSTPRTDEFFDDRHDDVEMTPGISYTVRRSRPDVR